MPEHPRPSKEELETLMRERSNWGRWGDDDERGAINLITAEKRLQAVSLVRSGRTVSLSRLFPKEPGPLNPQPAQHFMQRFSRPPGGGAVDYYGIMYHGFAATHIDALCHVWDEHGIWNGRDPEEVITSQGATFGDITNWRNGIVTRGVLLDIPRLRGEPYVDVDRPVHGWELEESAAAQGVEVGAGDALLIYSGREAFQAAHPDTFLGTPPSPGVHASCLSFIRDHDVSLLGWDMEDARPDEYGFPWPMHAVLFRFGVAILDNALLEPLAQACAAEGRSDFLLVVLPVPVQGGTGGPVNPLAMF